MTHGTLQEWNDEKGFGYIYPESSTEKVFAHVRDFRQSHPRPRNGDRVEYQTGTDFQGRTCAKRIPRPRLGRAPRPRFGWILPGLSLGYALWIGWQTFRGVYPLEFSLGLLFLSLLSYLSYAADKRRALRKAYRIPEARLHLLDVLGGWPGGCLAQQQFRHKTSKTSFQVVFFLCAALNIAVVNYLAAAPGWWKTGKFSIYAPSLLQKIERDLGRLF